MIARVWTDGCILKPNPGGTMAWAVRIELYDDQTLVDTTHVWDTRKAHEGNTNQVAEMNAVQLALETVLDEETSVNHLILISDSQWCVEQLKRKDSLAAGRKAWNRSVYFQEWAYIESLYEKFPIREFIHCRGHMKSGEWRNEICDRIAGMAARQTIHKEDWNELMSGWMEELCPTNLDV